MTTIVDLFRATATLGEMEASCLQAFVDETGELVVPDSHEHAITRMEDGWFLRLINPAPGREESLRALGWGNAPRQVWQ